jgi:hypothetical protein
MYFNNVFPKNFFYLDSVFSELAEKGSSCMCGIKTKENVVGLSGKIPFREFSKFTFHLEYLRQSIKIIIFLQRVASAD